MAGLLDYLTGLNPADLAQRLVAAPPANAAASIPLKQPGVIDYLTGNDASASPWGVLYQSPPDRSASTAREAATYGMSSIFLPQADPFGDPSKFTAGPAPASAPPTTGFGKGTVPFGFAGPGSMAITAGELGQKPVAAPAVPAASAVSASSPTDASSVNRQSGAAALPDDVVNVGNYRMPVYGERPEVEQPRAAATAAAPVAPFSIGGSDGRLMKGVRGFLGNMQSGPIGAILGGLGAVATGQETDPSSIASGKLNATAQALISKGASPVEVQAAINNPALMSQLISQYYSKDKWKVVQVGENGMGQKTFMQQNEVDGTLRPIQAHSAGGSENVGPQTITGPDGKQIQIPPGVDPKTFIKRVSETSADAAMGKTTEAQAKASNFAARMQKAEGILGGLQDQGRSFWQRAAGSVPMVGNYMQSTEYQRYKQAASAFITAMLRQESGAAISQSEFDRYEKELFPQPGDDASVVKQKASMRSAAIEQMSRSAGPGFKGPSPSGTVNVGGKAVNWSVN
ncbi:hypothetical protein VRZ08_01100 [Rhodopseudomonas sp. G2_2311]|uniref:hypothetical protein n=1 Tax=Rhodopseudomonas sp. G2_2311 TaxID=3114287 RepID=UPI0039C71253